MGDCIFEIFRCLHLLAIQNVRKQCCCEQRVLLLKINVLCSRILIREINSNHEARTPEGLARNVILIRELNKNVSEVIALCFLAATTAYFLLPVKPQSLDPQMMPNEGIKEAELGTKPELVLP